MKGMKIVGVVGDIRQGGPAGAPRPEIFMPYEQHPFPATSMSLVVRTASEPTAFAETLRRKARRISPDVPVKFTTLEVSLWENVAAPRFRTLLFGIFAALAVGLAMAGVYGVMAYVVGQRSGEIGLRMALGASPLAVMAMVMRQGLFAGRNRRGARPGGRGGRHAPADAASVRGEAGRSNDLCRRHRAAGGGGAGRQLHSGAPRHKSGSIGGLAAGVITQAGMPV